MQLAQVLDVLEGLFAASEHPDIKEIERYGHDTAPGGGSPAGVKVKHDSGSEAYLWGAVWPGAKPIPVPDEPLPPRYRASRLAVLAVQLLDVARPTQFRSWQLVAFPDLGPQPGVSPAGVSIVCSDGTAMLLRVTAGSGPVGDPADDPFPDYRIPEGVKEWHLRASAQSAAPE
ncbi:hypothetical protein [Actinoplanes sp. NPDC026623]|uniref:hypothetical protein n=1 Tax=Actinoplanes sp. NPDC026623 TaxID=3155610 RepID=UPI00340A3D81